MSIQPVKRFRRNLIFCLAGLCALLAAAVVLLRISRFRGEDPAGAEAKFYARKFSERAGWGNALEMLARQNRRLVFFTVKGSQKYVPNAKFKRLLNRHFYVVEMDPYQWPADYKILQSILERGTGEARDLEGGILLPNLSPLYLSSNLRGNPGAGVPPVSEAASAVAEKFFKYPASSREASAELPALLSVKNTPISSAFFGKFSESGIAWNIESIKLNDFFSRDTSAYFPSVVTENARLAASISRLSPRFKLACEAASKAGRVLEDMFDKNPPLIEKLLIARALFDLGMSGGGGPSGRMFSFAGQIAGMVRPDGRMMEKGKSAVTSENALAVQVLSRAASASGDRKYLEAAEKIGDYLEILLKTSSQMPSISDVSVQSQSSSRTYAFVAKAFADLHCLTGSDRYLALCRMLMDEWDKLFMTQGGTWSINSYSSALADVARPVIFMDARMPSYVGEAAQLMAYLKKADPMFYAPYSKKLEDISIGALKHYRFHEFSMASWKLSQVPDLEEARR